jgi:hypothetical protein
MQGEILYEEQLNLLPLMVIGAVPQGMRINIPFKGEVSGPKIHGNLEGIDYLLLRADAVGVVPVHAVLTTDEGELISVQASGITTALPDGRYAVKEVFTYQTASEKLAWLNSVQGFAEGFSDMSTNQLDAKVFKL